MNQPTEDRFKKIEERLGKVEQQQTEPIRVVLEQKPTEVESTLEKHATLLKEQDALLTKIYTDVGHAKADIGVIKTDMGKVKAEVLKIRESQADFRDKLQTMATKEDLTSLEARIEARFDRLEAEILRRLPKPEGE